MNSAYDIRGIFSTCRGAKLQISGSFPSKCAIVCCLLLPLYIFIDVHKNALLSCTFPSLGDASEKIGLERSKGNCNTSKEFFSFM